MIRKITENHVETLKKAGQTAQKVQAEFRTSAATAIITAFGLLAALSWQNTIKVYIDFLVTQIHLSQDPFLYNLYASIFITLISVIAIMIATRWAGRAEAQETQSKG